MLQIARNLTDLQSGASRAKRYLVIDRDTKIAAAIAAAGSGQWNPFSSAICSYDTLQRDTQSDDEVKYIVPLSR